MKIEPRDLYYNILKMFKRERNLRDYETKFLSDHFWHEAKIYEQKFLEQDE